MHEAAAVASAIDAVVREWPPDRRTGGLWLEVRDPTRAEATAVSFYAGIILNDRGLERVGVTVSSVAAVCDACGAESAPAMAHPICSSCGSPLRPRSGPAVVCHDLAPAKIADRSGD